LEQLPIVNTASNTSRQGRFDPVSWEFRPGLNRGAHGCVSNLLQDERTHQRAGRCGVDVKNCLLAKQSAQYESKTRLTQENCAWRPEVLLCSRLFQFLRENGICPPFCLDHDRIRQKFQRRRHSLHGPAHAGG
jgi:hypothetical protein